MASYYYALETIRLKTRLISYRKLHMNLKSRWITETNGWWNNSYI